MVVWAFAGLQARQTWPIWSFWQATRQPQAIKAFEANTVVTRYLNDKDVDASLRQVALELAATHRLRQEQGEEFMRHLVEHKHT